MIGDFSIFSNGKDPNMQHAISDSKAFKELHLGTFITELH